MRRFSKSPMMIVMSMIFPLMQLVVLGYAFGGNVKHLKLAIVDQDHGVPAVKIRELATAVSSGARTLDLLDYSDSGQAMGDLRNGVVNGVLTIPPDFSRRLLTNNDPRVALISDNTDTFVSASMAATVGAFIGHLNAPETPVRVSGAAGLDVVEVYPYVPYIQYLLPGSITMSIFMMVMIGGGIIFIDDKARGLHEGYLVTPITKLELVAGFNISGHHQGRSGWRRHHDHRVDHRRRSQPARSDALSSDDAGHFDHGVRADQPDVPVDGARHRPADAADDVRPSEHGAVLPQRSGVPAAGLPGLDARHRGRGPLHLFRTRLQEPAPQEHRLRGHRRRRHVSPHFFDHRDDGRNRALQADPVVIHPSSTRMAALAVDDRERETRQRLIESATRLFAERGFAEGHRPRDLQGRPRNVAAVNYHFGGKNGLYQEIVQSAIRTMHGTTQEIQKAGEGRAAEEQLRIFVRIFLARVVQARDGWIHRFMAHELNDPTPALDLVVKQVIKPRMAYLGSVIATLIDCRPNDPRVEHFRHERAGAVPRAAQRQDRLTLPSVPDHAEAPRTGRRPHHDVLARRDKGPQIDGTRRREDAESSSQACYACTPGAS
jgi:AcrR family transcriptional regulator